MVIECGYEYLIVLVGEWVGGWVGVCVCGIFENIVKHNSASLTWPKLSRQTPFHKEERGLDLGHRANCYLHRGVGTNHS